MTTPTLSTADPFAGPNRLPSTRIIPGFYITDADAPAKWRGLQLWTTKMHLSFGRVTVDVDAPYVPAGRVHDMRRKRWTVDLTIKWGGTDWKQRLMNFVAAIDSKGSADWLDLPGGMGSLYCKAQEGDVDWETIKEDCELTFQWKEDTCQERVDLLQQLHTSPLTQAQNMVPADAPEVQSAVDDYAETARDPNATDADRQQAMQDVYSAIGDERGDCDVDTPEGCAREDDLWTVQRLCQDGYPGDAPSPPAA